MAACVEVPEEKRSKYNNDRDTYLSILSIENDVAKQLLEIEYTPPVHLVYNPLEYAAEPHKNFVEKYGNSTKPVLLLGMNPGPFGMAQNGVGFLRMYVFVYGTSRMALVESYVLTDCSQYHLFSI